MRVSVILPTYNRAYIVGDAIRSALDQTYSPSEILVIDDGSSDDTQKILQSFSREGVRCLRHETNRGCSAAYNTGMSAAAGDLIAFLDSDDIWKPTYLERQVDFLSRHPEVGAVFTDTEIEGGSTRVESLVALLKCFSNLLSKKPEGREYIVTAREMRICLFEEVPIKPSAFVMKRELWTRFGGFNECWPSGTDWDLVLRLSRSVSFGYINQPLVIQRRTPDATHQIFREQDKLFLIEVFIREKRKSQGDHEALSAVDRGLLKHFKELGHQYLSSGQKRKAIATYFRGLKETRHFTMALRSAYACLPSGVTHFVRNAVAVSNDLNAR